jgi:hypothetical protein
MGAVRTHLVSYRVGLAGVVALCVLPLAARAAAADSDNVNVSHLPEFQTGATIAIDPSDGDTLLAGSTRALRSTGRGGSTTPS